ncbi:hypothetical protein K8Q93_02620 [Candidatus Parcubacteria bacterium]|nr:hypothetical protein [Candidatus Parcubacteria bacterium]
MTTQPARTLNEVGVIAATHRRPFRFLPRTADDWSCFLAGHCAWLVPLWLIGAYLWNPAYEPIRPWVWSVPWAMAFCYFAGQVMLLLKSAERSEQIGMKDMLWSLITFVTAFGMTLILLVLWQQGAYRMGAFTGTCLTAFVFATALELAATAWVRFLVNRRTFVAAGATSDSQP